MNDPERTLLPGEIPLPPRIDMRIAAFFLVLGSAIFAASLRMPTYLDQKGAIYVAPGLVPGLYGLIIAGLSLWLAVRAIGRSRVSGGTAGVAPDPAAPPDGTSNGRLAAAALLCLVYAVGLIGRIPFWAASAIFVAAFIALFEWTPGLQMKERTRPLAIAVVLGLVTGFLVTLVFQKIFYVRLP